MKPGGRTGKEGHGEKGREQGNWESRAFASDLRMSHGSGTPFSEGVSKHRRQASRELTVQVDAARAEASLSGIGETGGRHRRTHSRGLIVEAHDIAEASDGATPQLQQATKKHDHTAKSDPNFNSHSPECLRNRFPNYDHYQPRTAGLCMMIGAVFVIIAAAILLAAVVDLYLVPGFRIIPIGLSSTPDYNLESIACVFPWPRAQQTDPSVCMLDSVT